MFAYCKNNPIVLKDDTGFLASRAEEGYGAGGGGFGAVPIGSGFIDVIKGIGFAIVGTADIISKSITSKVLSDSQAHGNSKKSKKPQHGYEIYNIANGDVVKCGISGGKIRQDGKSYRAESQVRKFNRDPFDGNIYASRIVAFMPDRESALSWEIEYSQLLWDAGNSLSKHRIPRPWDKY